MATISEGKQMTPIERVARAIATSTHGDDEGWSAWVEEACAAISAMREPSDAMDKAGHRGHCFGRPSEMFRTMIDTALSE